MNLVTMSLENRMKSFLALPLTLALIAPSQAFSTEPPRHEEHHPAASAPANTPVDTAKMDAQMRAMRDMHEKMMSAKTPEERKALMAEHMKAMREGMSMMDGMTGAGSARAKTMSPQAMQKQMDMMKMMMQMMMDRMDATPPPGK
ncbi:hypothetical protein RugamoR1_03710 [Rugamonas sp. R1(2021)]